MGTMNHVPLPTGSYSLPDPHASCRDTINCFSELAPQTSPADSKQQAPPIVLRRAPGIAPFADDGTSNPVRGMWSMQSILYAVIGPALYTVSPAGALKMVASGIAGNSFVRMSDNSACLVIIIPGTFLGYTFDLGSLTLQQITDETFTSLGAIDLGFIDSYIVFLAVNGREFYNCDSQVTSGQGPITFNANMTGGTEFPREFGTDPFVGMAIDHREVAMFGERTSEFYIDAGNGTNSPFSSAPDNFMDIGCATPYGITKQDQSVFWIASDHTVRRRNGETPVRVSNHAIEAMLEQADLTGTYAFRYDMGGHPMAGWTHPAAGVTIVYDCTTTEWHKMASYGLSHWRPLTFYYAYGKQFVGDSLSGKIGILDTEVFTEWGQVRNAVWTHQAVYDQNKRIVHRRLELVLGGGFGSRTGQGQNPRITLKVSDDGGVTFRARPTRSLGTVGHYKNRIYWWNLGQARQRVYQFELSDPVPSWVVDAQIDLEGGTL